MPTGRLTQLPSFAMATLFVLAGSSAASSVDLSSVAAPLVVTFLLAVLALVSATSGDRAAGLATGLAGGADSFETRGAARQCDPDAAGHVRARAPGAAAPLRCC
jgi:uncharacterized protein DUF6412